MFRGGGLDSRREGCLTKFCLASDLGGESDDSMQLWQRS